MSAVAETIPGVVADVLLVDGDPLTEVDVIALGDGLLVVDDGTDYRAIPLSNVRQIVYGQPT